ncbi:MAG: hypothetical protein Q7T01_00420 [bacterium]|nr:hypothetical protein [bacterium]
MRWGVIACVVMLAGSASAQDWGLNVAGSESLGLDDGVEHLGFYPCVVVSYTFKMGEVAISPGLGVEWAAGGDFWGFMATVAADYPITESFGVDGIVAFVHDQRRGDWAHAGYYAGLGPGVSWFVTSRVTVTPNVLLFRGLNDDAAAWALGPGVNIWVLLN